MNRVQFSEAVLQSPRQFKQYLAGEEAIERIQKRAMNPNVHGVSGVSKLKYSQAVCIFVKFFFFDLYYCVFLHALGAILYYMFRMRSAALSVYVRAWRLEAYAGMVCVNYVLPSYKNILVDAINTRSYDAKEVYEHEPISLAKCDEKVLIHLHPHNIHPDGKVHFDSPGGQCSGLCDWLAYLYFKTHTCFRNPEHHLVAITEEVRDGAGKEAALLQLFQRKAPLCFGLKERLVAVMDNQTTIDKVSAVFNRLRPGFYKLLTIRHRMNLVVTKDGAYFFDPNKGLVKEDPTKFFGRELINKSLPLLSITEIFS